jgi:hypothetical protein
MVTDTASSNPFNARIIKARCEPGQAYDAYKWYLPLSGGNSAPGSVYMVE